MKKCSYCCIPCHCVMFHDVELCKHCLFLSFLSLCCPPVILLSDAVAVESKRRGLGVIAVRSDILAFADEKMMKQNSRLKIFALCCCKRTGDFCPYMLGAPADVMALSR